MQGRIVKVLNGGSKDKHVLKSFNVAIEDKDRAIGVVLEQYPELRQYCLDAEERLSPTALAFLDLNGGDVATRAGCL